MRPLRVAAAADVEPAFAALAARYEQKTGRQIVFTFAGSGPLAQQIEAGAPYDLYAAANEVLVEKLVKSGRIVKDSARPYARGRLALWVPVPAPASGETAAGSDSLTLAGLASPRFRRVALANPEHAPYGQAAVAALRSVGVYEELQARLVYAENVRQAQQYAATGNADAVIGAYSLLRGERRGVVVEVPAALHPPLVQRLGVVAGPGSAQAGADADERGARELADFILGSEGQRILEASGFLPP